MTTQFYEYEGSSVYVCENCMQDDLKKTREGKLVEDEAVTPNMVKRLPDPEHNAYQCDGCLAQSEGYDEMIDEYDDV